MAKSDISQDPIAGFLTALNVSDGLDIGWYHYRGDWDELQAALQDDVYHMFSSTVSLVEGSDNSAVYVGPQEGNLVLLRQWLDSVLVHPQKGVQIVVESLEQASPVLQELRSQLDQTAQPVWLQINAVAENGQMINVTSFAVELQATLPSATLSLSISCETHCTKEFLKDIWRSCENLVQPINIAVTLGTEEHSWLNLRWLLRKFDEMTLTLTPRTPAAGQESNTSFELLAIRNDFPKTRIFYDIPKGHSLAQFKSVSKTAGSPLNHFNVDLDAAKVTWAHGVNSREKLDKALKEGLMLLEVDVLLRGQGTAEQTDIPVMAHPPDTDSDITCEEWLDVVVKTDRGLKLDFKSIEAVEPSLALLNKRRSELHQPVWLNADVLAGPGFAHEAMNATRFLHIVQSQFPEATLSLGWQTGNIILKARDGYSKKMVEEMEAICRTFPQPVSLAVRAILARDSWCNFQWFLDQSPRYTITIWTGSVDIVAQEDMNYIRRYSEKSRVYFDLPPDLMPDI